ncbi:hypothetical protein [Cryptosporangium sp. NPDC051539]|uniref:hypothetical protein n=1 Tax=Cryptosporangium sp. NPDC051539 TaxID=3363962 RepID=UPI00379FD7EF
MPDDFEDRLTAAARDAHEHELTARRLTDLERRLAGVEQEISARRAEAAVEDRDVARLEGLSLTRVLASLHGARDDELAREKAEADVARYRLAEAEARRDAATRGIAGARARLHALAGAPSTYASLLDLKEQRLRESGDPRAARLLALAADRGRLTAELTELREAQDAGRAAHAALFHVLSVLRSAAGWSTFDVLGGGGLSTMVKHSKLDDAARAAAYADQCLAALRIELADVAVGAPIAPALVLSPTTRFVDVWFDNIFTDLSVGGRIGEARHRVADALRTCDQIIAHLDRRMATTGAALGEADTERQALLSG